MRRIEIAKLAGKLLGLFIMATAAGDVLASLLGILLSLGTWMFTNQKQAHVAFSSFTLLGLFPCGQFLAGLFVWTAAGHLAKHIVDEDGMRVTSVDWSPQSILSVALPIIGIVTGLGCLRSLFSEMVSLLRGAATLTEVAANSQLWSNLGVLALSVWLTLGSRGAARVITRLRRPDVSREHSGSGA